MVDKSTDLLVGWLSKARNELVVNAVAFQDHITRTMLQPDFSLTDPLWRCKRKAARSPQARGAEVRALWRQDQQEEREYVLESSCPPLTLAQKLGLVASPGERLTEDEWMQVKARSVHQGESAQPCAICREEFQLQPQVLLSCSHVFHQACLQAFERFSRKMCCPLCRKEQYETRLIHDAARLFRHQCATRIQACWRGYVARKRYKTLRKSICPKDKQLRRRFFEAKVIQRDVRDCPICLTALCSSSLLPEACTSTHGHRPTVLLSCSHLYHQLCLEAFEAFTVENRPSCPLCRSLYHKKLI
ncbi:RING finger protein 32 isoform X5 [Cheilinus undulatus]|uniref:RING finger protein 32 isoform X5 n=1 Tax=Cheilinus undulatus TaxID=241271 RepID=UPI001BD4188F|nr:RING finger protein 32 isoform X5 [Cheilinus undulatus]